MGSCYLITHAQLPSSSIFVNLLIFFIVFYSIWCLHTVFLIYCVSPSFPKLDVLNLGAVGIGSPSPISESEEFYETPSIEKYDWGAGDVAWVIVATRVRHTTTLGVHYNFIVFVPLGGCCNKTCFFHLNLETYVFWDLFCFFNVWTDTYGGILSTYWYYSFCLNVDYGMWKKF